MMRPVMMMSRGLLLFLCILSAFATTTAAAPMTTISAPMTTTQDLMTTSSSVQFWCGGTPCPAGQDCINVNGLLRCADPCEQYSVLDDAWRSTGYGRADNCDNRFSGQGWYRMFLDGNSTQMPETCVEVNRCGTQTPMWLNSSHPLLGDGVVEGDVCGHYRYYDYKINGQESTSHDDCCYYRHNIHVKSCPTNYYVYKFVRPNNCNSAYCAAVPTTTPAVPTTTPAVPMTPSSSVRFWCGATPCPAGQDCLSVNGALRCADPCEQYSVLDDAWRSTDLRNYGNLHCDQYINWQGWSRLFLGGNSTQMPETCVEENMCGTHAALWMTTPHPLLRDGVVERGTCGKWSWGAGNGNCCTFRSNPIHVKACPGNYYVYKFVKTSYCYLAYCAVGRGNSTTTTTLPPTTTTLPPTTTSRPTTTTTLPPTATTLPQTTTTLPPTTTPLPPTTTTTLHPTTTSRPTTTTPLPPTTTTTLPQTTTTTLPPTTTTTLSPTTTSRPTTTTTLPPTTTTLPPTTTSRPTTTTTLPPTTTTTLPPTTTTLAPTTTSRPTTTTTLPPTTTSRPTTTTTLPPTTTTLSPTTTTTTLPPTTTTLAPTTTSRSTTTPITKVTPELVCKRSYLDVGLLKSQLAAKHLDSSSVHLANARCSSQEINGTVWFQMERWEGSCGTTLKTNGSHAIYSNSLFVYPLSETMVQPLRIPFSCSYPLETEAGLDVAIKPYLDLEGALTEEGARAKTSMSLFRDANYTAPYSAGPVTLPLGSILHVGVSVEETDAEAFVVILEDCYATHSPDPDDLLKYFLIQHKCPTDRHQVTVEESGLSLQARFSVLLFLFQGDYRDVYLHCSLNLCDQRNSSCSPMCSGRSVRSVDELVPLKPVTIGPITWAQSLE